MILFSPLSFPDETLSSSSLKFDHHLMAIGAYTTWTSSSTFCKITHHKRCKTSEVWPLQQTERHILDRLVVVMLHFTFWPQWFTNVLKYIQIVWSEILLWQYLIGQKCAKKEKDGQCKCTLAGVQISQLCSVFNHISGSKYKGYYQKCSSAHVQRV